MLKHHTDRRDATKMRNGFTLVELLVVIVILGILAAVVVFAVAGIRDKGDESACKADFRTLESAIEAWNAQGPQSTASSTTAPIVRTTDWPTTEAELVTADLLKRESTKYDLVGAGTPAGSARPTIESADLAICPDNPLP